MQNSLYVSSLSLYDKLYKFGSAYSSKNNKILTSACKIMSHYFTKDAKDNLLDLKNGNNFNGYALFHGVPIDQQLPKTPSDLSPSLEKHTNISELSILSVANFLGNVFTYEKQNSGTIVHDISPIKEKEISYEGSNSLIELSFHNDGISEKITPDFVMLICLRSGDNPPSTSISHVKNIIQLLSPEHLNILSSDFFLLKKDYELYPNSQDKITTRIIHYSEGDIFIRYDLDLLIGINDESHTALKSLERAIRDSSIDVTLNSGDLLVIDNKRSVHSRSAYIPKYNGYDRWLQSTYSTTLNIDNYSII